MGYVSKNIDHLGIVATLCKEIELVKEIDKIVGVKDRQKVTTGEAVKCRFVNGSDAHQNSELLTITKRRV